MIVFDARYEKWHPEGLDHCYIVSAPMVSPGMHQYGDEAEVARFQVFEDALNAYEGTIVFVSHNLAFARKLATQVWDVDHGCHWRGDCL